MTTIELRFNVHNYIHNPNGEGNKARYDASIATLSAEQQEAVFCAMSERGTIPHRELENNIASITGSAPSRASKVWGTGQGPLRIILLFETLPEYRATYRKINQAASNLFPSCHDFLTHQNRAVTSITLEAIQENTRASGIRYLQHWMGYLPALAKLDLSFDMYQGPAAQAALEKLPHTRVTTLSISSIHRVKTDPRTWGTLSMKHVCALSQLRNLTSLSIQFCPHQRLLEALQPLMSLTHLDLSSSILPQMDLSPLRYLQQLRSLVLKHCQIEDFSKIWHHKRLLSLDISHNHKVRDTTFFAFVSQVPNLTYLDTSHCYGLLDANTAVSMLQKLKDWKTH
jgi:hypothetical protein